MLGTPVKTARGNPPSLGMTTGEVLQSRARAPGLQTHQLSARVGVPRLGFPALKTVRGSPPSLGMTTGEVLQSRARASAPQRFWVSLRAAPSVAYESRGPSTRVSRARPPQHAKGRRAGDPGKDSAREPSLARDDIRIRRAGDPVTKTRGNPPSLGMTVRYVSCGTALAGRTAALARFSGLAAPQFSRDALFVRQR